MHLRIHIHTVYICTHILHTYTHTCVYSVYRYIYIIYIYTTYIYINNLHIHIGTISGGRGAPPDAGPYVDIFVFVVGGKRSVFQIHDGSVSVQRSGGRCLTVFHQYRTCLMLVSFSCHHATFWMMSIQDNSRGWPLKWLCFKTATVSQHLLWWV